jgi:hypothetical protein
MTTRAHCIITVATTLLMQLSNAPGQNYLTDITVFGSSSDGSYAPGDVWITRPGSLVFNTFIAQGAPGAGGPFLNGPGTAQSRPNISMSLGSDQFALFGFPGADEAYFGVNLFFNGSATPSISAFGPLLTSPGGAHSFLADSSLNTSGPTSNVAAAGTLSFTANGEQITLSDFFWATPSVYNLDEVGPFSVGADGRADYVGGLTFSVVQVPEPGISLWALGLAFGGFSIGRRAGRFLMKGSPISP